MTDPKPLSAERVVEIIREELEAYYHSEDNPPSESVTNAVRIALTGQDAQLAARDAEIARQRAFWDAMRECREWANAQFPNSIPTGKAKHLAKEAYELAADPSSGEEMADVLMIFAHLAEWEGVDLAAELRRKLAINRERQWGAPDADGVIEHVRAALGGNHERQ